MSNMAGTKGNKPGIKSFRLSRFGTRNFHLKKPVEVSLPKTKDDLKRSSLDRLKPMRIIVFLKSLRIRICRQCLNVAKLLFRYFKTCSPFFAARRTTQESKPNQLWSATVDQSDEVLSPTRVDCQATLLNISIESGTPSPADERREVTVGGRRTKPLLFVSGPGLSNQWGIVRLMTPRFRSRCSACLAA